MCMLMIISAMTAVIYTNDTGVKASGEGNNEVGLDYDFMWSITQNLSNIVQTSYPGNVLSKGRMFGTDGDHDAARYINDTIMTNTLHLKNVNKITLGPIKELKYREV